MTGAPWKSRNLYLPESLPKAMTEPEKVIAPINVPMNNSIRFPIGSGTGILNASGSETAAIAIHTAARPIMLCINATSSGIFVISTRLAITAPIPPPTTSPPKTYIKPLVREVFASLLMSPTVVKTAIAIPIIPNKLPRIEVVGCDKPLSA